jgi:hypothetical protein
MARPAYGGGPTCESYNSIDVRRWHREGRLHAGQSFMCSWTWHGEPSGSIDVRTETDAAVLKYRTHRRAAVESKSVEQRIPITWTRCHFGGRRPWFICSVYSNGRYCGRRVAVLYGAGELYACRRCYGLAYASQQGSPMDRGLTKAQKIRERLGGSTDIFDVFPDKPKGMHWTTYNSLQVAHEAARERVTEGLARMGVRR